eukprot:COSAG01_NODE_7337_length_3244_cov_3.393005_3_plen_113_part_00
MTAKTNDNYYWWEVLISIRKLLLVAAARYQSTFQIHYALLITVAALVCQMTSMPFANTDANIAETSTLLATLLALCLALVPASTMQQIQEVTQIQRDSELERFRLGVGAHPC